MLPCCVTSGQNVILVVHLAENILNSQRMTREHRKRKTASAKTPVNPTLEEANPEGGKCFEAFINQLGANRNFEEQVADHNKEVQQLCEEMEQQIEREKQWLQDEGKTRSQLGNMEMKKVLDVREQEIQHFLTAQKELETQFVGLRENQQMAKTNAEGLKQANRALENQLQETLHQLQRTQRYLDAMKNRVAQRLKEDRASDDLASATTAASVSRTRAISIEEDPVVNSSVGEEHRHPQETSSQSNLLKELKEATAAMSRVSDESHEQPTGDVGFQGEELVVKMRHARNPQPSARQQKSLSQDGRLSAVDGREKRMSAAPTSRATFQREALLKEASTGVQDGALEMKDNHASEPRMEVRPPEPTPKGRPPPGIQYPLYSDLTADLEDYKEGQLQRDILASQAPIQPESHKQAFKSSNITPTQELSTDSEKGEEKQTRATKTGTQKIPSHMPGKDVVPAHSPSRTALLRLHVGPKSETALVRNDQFKNIPDLEMQAHTPAMLEVSLPEKGREGKVDVSEYKKNQDVKTVMGDETKHVPECSQVTRQILKGTRALGPHPDHLYNVLFVGDTNVGKTSFLRRLQDGSFDTSVTATVGIDYRIKNVYVDNKWFALQLWDTAGQERYHSLTKQFFRKADGIVLMYDIASEQSFTDTRYWLNCIQEGAGDGVIVLLLGNKTDCTAERRISKADGESLAKEYELSFCECSAALGHNVTESMVKLARLLKTHEEQLKQEILELSVTPKKKSRCCS